MSTPDLQTELKAAAAATRAILAAETAWRELDPPDLAAGVRAYPDRAGKMLRPALVRWACGAVGGDPEQARFAAAAVEVFHTWTLVHDDIIDGDETRRGGPAVHALVRDRAAEPVPAAARADYGRSMAILAGDVQHAWANSLLLRGVETGIRPAVLLALIQRLNGVVAPGLLSGEALDVALEYRDIETLDPAVIDRMSDLKTGVLLRFAAECGAMIGADTDDPDHARVRALGDYGQFAGRAFQMQDDILGWCSDEATLGKPVGADLRRGKRTLLLAAAWRRLTATDRRRLAAALGNPAVDDAELRDLARMLLTNGVFDAVQETARDLIAAAKACLHGLPASREKALLLTLADFFLERRH